MLHAVCKSIDRLAVRGAAISTMLLLGGLVMQPRPTLASPTIQTFGPGTVSCQALAGTQMDCLLSVDRITSDISVVSFDLGLLPHRDQALFRKSCLAATDVCTVSLTGQRVSAESTRLSAVTSVQWIRPSAATVAQ